MITTLNYLNFQRLRLAVGLAPLPDLDRRGTVDL
jgi:hypothetical protein